jgi:hypothetical protein
MSLRSLRYTYTSARDMIDTSHNTPMYFSLLRVVWEVAAHGVAGVAGAVARRIGVGRPPAARRRPRRSAAGRAVARARVEPAQGAPASEVGKRVSKLALHAGAILFRFGLGWAALTCRRHSPRRRRRGRGSAPGRGAQRPRAELELSSRTQSSRPGARRAL